MYAIVNGVRLFFDVHGEKLVVDGPRMREKPTLLLLHGGPGFDHTMFKPDFAQLADVAQLIYLDHRGNGRSERGDPALWTLDQWADDVRTFCDVLGIEKPVVLGYSFGGFVAQAYATRYQEHPAKLILYSTAPVMLDAPALDAFEAIGGREARAVAAAYFADPNPETRAAFRTTCFPLYNPTPDDPLTGLRQIVNNDVALHFFEGEVREMDFRPVLDRISCPTLILAGEKDPRTPPVLARMIADAISPKLVRFELLRDCGHGPHKDQPARVLEMLREFVLAPA